MLVYSYIATSGNTRQLLAGAGSGRWTKNVVLHLELVVELTVHGVCHLETSHCFHYSRSILRLFGQLPALLYDVVALWP